VRKKKKNLKENRKLGTSLGKSKRGASHSKGKAGVPFVQKRKPTGGAQEDNVREKHRRVGKEERV